MRWTNETLKSSTGCWSTADSKRLPQETGLTEHKNGCSFVIFVDIKNKSGVADDESYSQHNASHCIITYNTSILTVYY